VQAADQRERQLGPSHHHVPEVEDFVVGPDAVVPAVDEAAVHPRHVVEGPRAVLDDVGVPEVGVSGEPHER
jgi:hypothetical protein